MGVSEFWTYYSAFAPYSPALTIVCMVLGIVLVSKKQGSNELTWLFTSFSVTLIIWSILRITMRLVEGEENFVVWANFYYAASVIVSAQMMQAIIAIQQPGQSDVPRFVGINWVMAVLLAVTFLVTDQGVQGRVLRPWGYEPVLGAFGRLVWPWQCLLMLGILQHFRQRWTLSNTGSSERLRLKALIPMLVFIALGTMNFFHDLTGLLLPLTFVFITLFGASLIYASFRFGLLDTSLSSVIGELSNQLKQGLMVVDNQSIVRYANPAAADILHYPVRHMRSVKMTDLMGRQFDGQWDYFQKRMGKAPRKFDWLYEAPSGEAKNLSVSMHVDRVNQEQDLIYILSFEDKSETADKVDTHADSDRLDPLTRLMLRDTFEEVVASAIGTAKHGRRFEMVLFAIDDYKGLKRQYGQLVVDQCVSDLVRRVQVHRKSSDVMARLSEDELAMYIPVNDGEPRAVNLISELRASFAGSVKIGDDYLGLTVSTARSTVDSGAQDAGQCLKTLIRTLRLAQAAGKDQHFNADSADILSAPSALEAELIKAIQQRQFVVHYQPVLDVQSRRMVAVEALVRWQHPERGLLFPGDFIEFAEDVGLGAAIDHDVMRQGLRDVAELNKRFAGYNIKVNFNIGAEQLGSPNFVDEVIGMVNASGLRTSEVQLEVLERSALSKEGAFSLHKLDKAGFVLAVDDFGTGYSSLARLQDLPVNLLKIDRSFVDSIDEPSGAAVVRSIAHIAHRLDLDVVVEGVETAEQLTWFCEQRCFKIQGWLFAKASPFEQIEQWMALSEFPSVHWLAASPKASNGSDELGVTQSTDGQLLSTSVGSELSIR